VLAGPDGMAAIGVRKGQLAFDIDIPTSAGARAQLITLATRSCNARAGCPASSRRGVDNHRIVR